MRRRWARCVWVAGGKQLAERQSDVHARLADVEEREAAVERQASHIKLLKQQVAEQMPDVGKLSEIMRAGEQEEREQRDGKVLRVLRTKDESIATLNAQLQALERVLEHTRGKLAASDKSLQDKLKESDRAWRQHEDALASSQVPFKDCCRLPGRASHHASWLSLVPMRAAYVHPSFIWIDVECG